MSYQFTITVTIHEDEVNMDALDKILSGLDDLLYQQFQNRAQFGYTDPKYTREVEYTYVDSAVGKKMIQLMEEFGIDPASTLIPDEEEQ